MGRFCTAAVLILGLLATRAEATELEGFGPIKFGMTKDQAWEAIEGKGEWTKPDILRYERSSGDAYAKLEVEQEFKNGRAADVSVLYSLDGGTSDYCLAKALHFAAVIENKYGISAATRYGTLEALEPWKEGSTLFDIEDIYAFVFDDNATIQMIAKYTFGEPWCVIAFRYIQPSGFIVPF